MSYIQIVKLWRDGCEETIVRIVYSASFVDNLLVTK